MAEPLSEAVADTLDILQGFPHRVNRTSRRENVSGIENGFFDQCSCHLICSLVFIGGQTLFLVSKTARKNQEQSLTPSPGTIPRDTIPMGDTPGACLCIIALQKESP